MDVKVAETLGTGLTDVVRLLLELPTEQLLSLTYQLGETPEEDIVHALSLLFLHKETRGLDLLQALQDNSLANHLAKKWHTAGGKLEDFRKQCGHLDNVAVLEETLAHLARIFKVLSEKRLCDTRLRDLAYWRAVSACGEKTSHSKGHLLIEEAEAVCGPQFAEKMHSQSQPQSCALVESTALFLSQGTPEGNLSIPSSLQSSSSFDSYPTHLEISLPPTAVLISDKITTVKSQHSHPSTTPPSVGEDKLENNAPGSYHSSISSEAPSMFTSENASTTTPCSIATTDVNSPQEDDSEKQTTTTASVRSKSSPATPAAPSTSKITVPGKHTDKEEGEEEEEEEQTFYAFVILHAAEDVEMAAAMKERLESICGGGLVGATFSEDFALPGKSSLRCIDDAIDNSAFTILLLTNHFSNTRQFQVETESALINSIQKRPKYNTVIPLLPRENGMTKTSLPIVLQTMIPLEENRNFERMIKKVLSAKRVGPQRMEWLKEQQMKKKQRRQERMKLANKQCKIIGDLNVTTAMLEQERLRLIMEHTLQMQRMLGDLQTIPCAVASSFPCPSPGWPPQNIHVENAKYIMIGNDSTMTVDHVIKDDDN